MSKLHGRWPRCKQFIIWMGDKNSVSSMKNVSKKDRICLDCRDPNWRNIPPEGLADLWKNK